MKTHRSVDYYLHASLQRQRIVLDNQKGKKDIKDIEKDLLNNNDNLEKFLINNNVIFTPLKNDNYCAIVKIQTNKTLKHSKSEANTILQEQNIKENERISQFLSNRVSQKAFELQEAEKLLKIHNSEEVLKNKNRAQNDFNLHKKLLNSFERMSKNQKNKVFQYLAIIQEKIKSIDQENREKLSNDFDLEVLYFILKKIILDKEKDSNIEEIIDQEIENLINKKNSQQEGQNNHPNNFTKYDDLTIFDNNLFYHYNNNNFSPENLSRNKQNGQKNVEKIKKGKNNKIETSVQETTQQKTALPSKKTSINVPLNFDEKCSQRNSLLNSQKSIIVNNAQGNKGQQQQENQNELGSQKTLNKNKLNDKLQQQRSKSKTNYEVKSQKEQEKTVKEQLVRRKTETCKNASQMESDQASQNNKNQKDGERSIDVRSNSNLKEKSVNELESNQVIQDIDQQQENPESLKKANNRKKKTFNNRKSLMGAISSPDKKLISPNRKKNLSSFGGNHIQFDDENLKKIQEDLIRSKNKKLQEDSQNNEVINNNESLPQENSKKMSSSQNIDSQNRLDSSSKSLLKVRSTDKLGSQSEANNKSITSNMECEDEHIKRQNKQKKSLKDNHEEIASENNENETQKENEEEQGPLFEKRSKTFSERNNNFKEKGKFQKRNTLQFPKQTQKEKEVILNQKNKQKRSSVSPNKQEQANNEDEQKNASIQPTSQIESPQQSSVERSKSKDKSQEKKKSNLGKLKTLQDFKKEYVKIINQNLQELQNSKSPSELKKMDKQIFQNSLKSLNQKFHQLGTQELMAYYDFLQNQAQRTYNKIFRKFKI